MAFSSAKFRDSQAKLLLCELEALTLPLNISTRTSSSLVSRPASWLTANPVCKRTKGLSLYVFSQSPCLYLPINHGPISSLSQTCFGIGNSAFRFRQPLGRSLPDLCLREAKWGLSHKTHINKRHSCTAWLAKQAECADLRLTYDHLEQGTRPSRKLTITEDVKRFLNVAFIAKDGLLVINHNEPLSSSRECIIVPRWY